MLRPRVGARVGNAGSSVVATVTKYRLLFHCNRLIVVARGYTKGPGRQHKLQQRRQLVLADAGGALFPG
ncbi:hypothetical protein LX90_009129 [Lentzea flava]|nr:hypothetical protein [Lentzea flava]